MKSPVTKFMNCFILRGHQIRKEDLYVRDGKVLNPEPFFYDEKKSPDVVINCKGCLIAPGELLIIKVTFINTEKCCSELVGCTRLYFQTAKFGLHFGLKYSLW